MTRRSNRSLPVLVLLLVLAAGCGGDPHVPHPTLLVAVDGVEWDVVLPLLRDGRLPTLRKLMERGRFGELESFRPTSSPIIWTTVATGKLPEKHGILGFVTEEDEGSDDPSRLYTNLDRTTKAIWNILSDEERRVAIVGWWLTFPVEEVDGIMVAQTNTLPDAGTEESDKFWKGALYEKLEGQVHPAELQAEILSVVPEVEAEMPELTRRLFGELPDPFDPVAGRLWEACRWSLRADEIYRRIALDLLRDGESFDLFAVYFGGPDVLGHRFWRYLFPNSYENPPTDEQVRAYGRLIPDYYVHIDAILGELLAAAPIDANVIVVSDHGMSVARKDKPFEPTSPVKSLRSGGHRQAPPGILVAAGPDIRSTPGAQSVDSLERGDIPRVGSVLDVTPTLLALMGVPLGRDMDGQVMAEVTEAAPTGWVDSHTPDGWFRGRSDAVQTPMSEERLEQLRGLGYIGGADDD